MIHIPDNQLSKIQFLVGSPENIATRPDRIFAPSRIEFLSDLSSLLLGDPRLRHLPDVVTFGFWCRKANISKLGERWNHSPLQMGLGLVFHISPSNVPVNFAFSLAFSLLAGNSTLLRLPTRNTPQTDALIAAIGSLLNTPKHESLASVIHLIRYERDDAITAFLLENSAGRIIWGGDSTIDYMRSFKTHPRSREVAFADRYSLSVISAESIAVASSDTVTKLCSAFYNDVYLMDQNACSSPQLLAWVGSDPQVEAAKAKFWPAFYSFVEGKYEIQPINAVNKYVDLCSEIIQHENIKCVRFYKNLVCRVELSHLTANQHEQRGRFGTIHEINLGAIGDLAPIINQRYQTLAYFGFEAQHFGDFIAEHRLSGIDRVVPIGRALDMGLYWDGFDIISCLSRLVDVQ